MATASVPSAAGPVALTVERYFGLVEAGVLQADDRVELLNGVVVSMAPIDPPHAASVNRTEYALRRVLADRAIIRTQSPFCAGEHSVPEPDVAVVAGSPGDYDREHPRTALLLVEVSDSTLKQDRITKAAIYAAAGIPEYWIVNLRDDRVEVHRDPEPATGRYRAVTTHGRGEPLTLVALPGAIVNVGDLLPDPERDGGRRLRRAPV
jgi:Uma2 family endonuclease